MRSATASGACMRGKSRGPKLCNCLTEHLIKRHTAVATIVIEYVACIAMRHRRFVQKRRALSNGGHGQCKVLLGAHARLFKIQHTHACSRCDRRRLAGRCRAGTRDQFGCNRDGGVQDDERVVQKRGVASHDAHKYVHIRGQHVEQRQPWRRRRTGRFLCQRARDTGNHRQKTERIFRAHGVGVTCRDG